MGVLKILRLDDFEDGGMCRDVVGCMFPGLNPNISFFSMRELHARAHQRVARMLDKPMDGGKKTDLCEERESGYE